MLVLAIVILNIQYVRRPPELIAKNRILKEYSI